MTVDEPQAFLAETAPGLVEKLFGSPPRVEGYYLQVNDRANRPFYIDAASFRSGAGHRWIRPDLTEEGASGDVDHSAPAPEG